MPKNLNKVEIEDVPVVDDPLLDVAAELVELPVAAVPAAGPIPGKRALGVKEPIIFKWKLIGTSRHMTLTLFKAVEREEVDAQLERLQKEGYYTDLKILEADAKVDQPVQPKGMKKVVSPSERSRKGAAPPATRTAVAKRSSAAPTLPSRRRATATSALKTVKSAKKKPSGSARGSKRASKKK